MNDIFITGANGWLGTALVREFLDPQDRLKPILGSQNIGEIRCLKRPGEVTPHYPSNITAAANVRWVEGDLTQPDSLAEAVKGLRDPLVFHLAGMIHPKVAREFYQVNHQGTVNLFEQINKYSRARRMIVMSSNSPMGCNPHPDHLFDENSPYNPYMGYGKSKMLMEQYVKSTDVDWTIVRGPWFYGPHQPDRQTLFFKMIKEGKVPIVGDGNNLRSMAYVRNLTQGLILSGFDPKASKEIFWIADIKPYSMNEVIDTIEDLLAHDFGMTVAKKRLRLPSVVSDIAYLVDSSLQAMGLYHQKFHVLSEMNKTIACSVAKAQKTIGYAPAYSLRDGMRESIADMLQRGLKL